MEKKPLLKTEEPPVDRLVALQVAYLLLGAENHSKVSLTPPSAPAQASVAPPSGQEPEPAPKAGDAATRPGSRST